MAIKPTDPLRDAPEDQIGISIPSPLNKRLDSLVARTNGAGENTSRKEVLAALLLSAPDREEELVRLLRRYRMAAAAEAVPAGDDPDAILSASESKPGPRPRRTR